MALTPTNETTGLVFLDKSTQTEPHTQSQRQTHIQTQTNTLHTSNQSTQTAFEVEEPERVSFWHGRRMVSVSADYAVKFSSFSTTPMIGIDHLDKSCALVALSEKGLVLANIPENPHSRRVQDTIDEIRYLYGRHISYFDSTKSTLWLIGPAYEGRPDWLRELKMAVLRRELGQYPKRKFYEYVDFHNWAKMRDPVLLFDATDGEVLVKINGVDVTEEWRKEWPENREPEPETPEWHGGVYLAEDE